MVVFNCHVPSIGGTYQRKRDVVQKFMEVATRPWAVALYNLLQHGSLVVT